MALALNILGDKIDALVDMTIVYPDGVPDYGDFWLGNVSRIAVDLRKIEIQIGYWVEIMKMIQSTRTLPTMGRPNLDRERPTDFTNEI